MQFIPPKTGKVFRMKAGGYMAGEHDWANFLWDKLQTLLQFPLSSNANFGHLVKHLCV